MNFKVRVYDGLPVLEDAIRVRFVVTRSGYGDIQQL